VDHKSAVQTPDATARDPAENDVTQGRSAHVRRQKSSQIKRRHTSSHQAKRSQWIARQNSQPAATSTNELYRRACTGKPCVQRAVKRSDDLHRRHLNNIQ